MSTPATETKPAPETKPERRRIAVSPEVAAELHRRRYEYTAAIATANAMIAAVQSAARSTVAIAASASEAAERMALTLAGIEDGTIVSTEGLGTATVMVVELPVVATEPPT